MRFAKYVAILFLILIFSVSGCGLNKTGSQPVMKEEPVDKGIIPIEPVKEEQPAAIQEPIRAPVEAAEKPVAGSPVSVPPTKIGTPEKPVSETGELIIADFESWPNNLGGEIGVYGSLEPDWEKVNQQPASWVYEVTSLNYIPGNVHAGKNSFRLVNAIGTKPEYTWGSFSMDLGPTTDITSVPKKVESLDASVYKYLTFWVRGEKGGEKMELLVRDAHALNYLPQIKYKLPDASTEWKKVVVALTELSGKVDLTKLDNIGMAFGKDVGNLTGDTIYIDDFAFTNNP